MHLLDILDFGENGGSGFGILLGQFGFNHG